jgi:hypothetical protein
MKCQNGARRQGFAYAVPETGALEPAALRSGPKHLATGGSGGNTIRDEIRFNEPMALFGQKKRRGVYTNFLTLP